MKLGDVINLQGQGFRIIDEFIDSYLAISEIGFTYKTLPKLQIIK